MFPNISGRAPGGSGKLYTSWFPVKGSKLDLIIERWSGGAEIPQG